jgi:hypothetical protein
MPSSPRREPTSLRDRDPSDPWRRAVELAQRGRMILDVCSADLEAAEAAFGPFHPTAWHFRNELDEARRSWDRLRAEVGGAALDAALNEPPLTVLTLQGATTSEADRDGRRIMAEAQWLMAEGPCLAACPSAAAGRPAPVVLVPIAGQTYRAQHVAGTPLAPVQWRLTRLRPPLDGGPYYACRLHDGSTQCDCAEWIYRGDEGGGPPGPCKHLAALASLGWI